MLEEVLLAGFGGQGILSAGMLLAQAGMAHGLYVAWIPSYGPEMRGGTANCGVTLSDRPISCPLVTEPTTLLAMNQPSLDKFAPKVKPGGLIIYNSSLARWNKELGLGRRMLGLDATAQAEAIGNVRVAVNVLVGAFIALTQIIPLEKAKEALRVVLPPHRHHLIAANEKALEVGANLALAKVGEGIALR
ncbi:Pyruvate/ketoisovalerate oxidoreductase [Ammonifex degensii KC4]|uniref:Pyruvate/ketoisovalerate oxidoreductase n=1 Tax=Ammonifex degensii (strain DSM 10501 / KC4) TaxID=429009 RepID=C9R856_AMMDK|nr:2-oxoacid:acceptor oxidoreductase family protein [Ammonifex degensii]ACX52485.1 Pyruvate/ketoisovalerate oxidoreductase [Ammonifex degensii KC4]